MAVLPATPSGVVAIDHKFTIGANANVNSRLKFAYSSATPSAAALTSLAAAVQGAWDTNMKAWLMNAFVLNEIVCQDLANPANPVGLWSGTDAGSRTGGVNDAGVCVVAQYPITRRYRGGHPRGYWPLLGSGDLATAGTWNGTVLGNLTTALRAYIAAIKALTAGGFTITNQVSVSYFSGPVYPAVPAGTRQHSFSAMRATPVIDIVGTPTVSVRPGSQRRRLKRA